MTNRKRSGSFLAAMLLAAALCGCGASSKSSDAAMAVAETAASAPMVEEAAVTPAAGAAGNHFGAIPQVSPGADIPDEKETPTQPEDSSRQDSPAAISRKLIRTVFLTMETTEFDPLLEELSQTVTNLGGYVESSNVSGSSILASPESRRYANLIVRIPSDQLDGFLSQMESLGNVTNRSESTEDVTLQYSDMESRKKALLIEQERLLELLAEAESMDAVIALESRLSEIRYQLESIESQLRIYDNQVDYSTVHIDLSEVKVFTSTSPDSIGTRIQKGFSKNLKSVSDGLVNFFVMIITSLPTLVVLAVILGILVLILRKLIRFDKRQIQKNKKTDSPETGEKTEAPVHKADSKSGNNNQQ